MKIISRQLSSCIETIVAFPAKRIKFKCDGIKLPESPVPEEWIYLAKTLDLMRSYGCCPVGEGGHVCGNIAIRIKNYLIVSRSKRRLAQYRPEDFPKVIKFDLKAWKATFQSRSRVIEPTSDTPLHWVALMEAPKKLKWSERPLVSLHGHALTTARSAHNLKLPISSKITAFGTSEDCAALMDLFKRYPYPKNKIFIRRGHGFLLLGKDIADVITTFQEVLGRKKKQSKK